MLVVGDPTDPHVVAVTRVLPSAIIFDASTIHEHTFDLTLDTFTIDGRQHGADYPSRGWIRRLAPATWAHGITTGSQRAAAQAAAVSLIAAIARTPGIEWLTDLDALLIGESKVVQMRAASRLGIRTPTTLITHSGSLARARLGRHVVIKPLGPGTYTRTDQSEAIVYATKVDLDDPAFADLGPTPFLVQEVIDARCHYRIVTVGNRAWVTTLDAADRPLDWRSQDSAHQSFRHDPSLNDVLGTAAVRLASVLGLRYSSQDWVRSTTGETVVLDVNPGGQWAFLPEPVTHEVGSALSSWLRGH